MSDKKKFGLVMPKKVNTLKTKINSVFNDDSDEEEHAKKRPKIPQKVIKKSSFKTDSDIDPTIYEYDSIYDEMKTKQAESSGPKEAKSSRYIETLLKAADKRKKEYERRIDRKIQIEREKEGDQYKDKEAFVTSSYKKKLQEKEEEEERERRENMLNDMMDVTKQKDLSGFYRHFLNQSIGEEKVPLFGEKQIKKEVESDQGSTADKVDENINNIQNLDQDSDGIEIDNEDDDSERDFSNNEKCHDEVRNKKTVKKKRSNYRDRKENYKKQISTADKVDENISNIENLDQDSDGIEVDNEDDDSERDFDNNEKCDDEVRNEKTIKKKRSNYGDRKENYKKQRSVSNVSEKFEKSRSPKQDETVKKTSINSDPDTSSSDYQDNENSKNSLSLDKNKKKDEKDINKHNSRHDSSSSDDEHSNNNANSEAAAVISKEERQKNIYAKRTVGDVFAEAQARYFQRMAMRNS